MFLQTIFLPQTVLRSYRALALLATLTLSTSLHALPVPKAPPPDLHSVHMVQQSIPMPDGVHLSATLYMPGDAKPGEKFPALLEYLPYRKDDATAASDYPIHAWFAARGYVSVRVDIRGFGSSEGVPTDREYSEQEQLELDQWTAPVRQQRRRRLCVFSAVGSSVRPIRAFSTDRR